MITREGIREALTVGASRYDEALRVLDRYGRAGFIQTGGMCAALEVVLERGHLLVTDAEDSLPWHPEELRAWGVGYYTGRDVSDGPHVFVDNADVTGSGDTGVATLAALVEQCLARALAAHRS